MILVFGIFLFIKILGLLGRSMIIVIISFIEE
jgi:hypothetical protein